MSTLDSKLEPVAEGTGGVAECRLKHLRNRWGVVDAYWVKTPQIVQVESMGVRETWELWGNNRGEDSTYHLTGREKL